MSVVLVFPLHVILLLDISLGPVADSFLVELSALARALVEDKR